MGKYKFSTAERFGTWEAFDGRCFWCNEPIKFKEMSIDHVIPESVDGDDVSLNRIKAHYALPADFKINDFCNWVPAHSNCNSSKSQTIFPFSPAMIATLEYVGKRSEKARKTSDRVAADKKKSNILARIEVAAEMGVISNADIKELFGGIEPLTQPDNVPVLLHIATGWSVLRATGNLLYVTNGQAIGYTSSQENPDASWICPTCSNYGPWNGVICLSCGHRSAPGD